MIALDLPVDTYEITSTKALQKLCTSRCRYQFNVNSYYYFYKYTSSALPHDEAGSTNWEDFDVHNFCNAFVEVISYVSTGKSRAISFQERIKAFRIEFDLQFDWVEDKSLLAVRMLVNLHGCNVKPEVQRECYTNDSQGVRCRLPSVEPL